MHGPRRFLCVLCRFGTVLYHSSICSCCQSRVVPTLRFKDANCYQIGTTKNTANYLITVLNAAQLVGRFVPAWLNDFYGGADMLLFAQVLIGILGLHWITIATLGGLVEWLIFVGIFSGMVATLPAVTIPFISPNPDTLGTRIGFIYGAAGLGALVGNPIAFAATGNTSVRHGFLGAQLWMGLCGLLGAAWFIVPGRSAKRNRKAMLG